MGRRFCMVTHDPRYAQHADRVIHLFDGLIVEEETGSHRREIEEAKRELKEAGFGTAETSLQKIFQRSHRRSFSFHRSS